jgi:hypothetical protein
MTRNICSAFLLLGVCSAALSVPRQNDTSFAFPGLSFPVFQELTSTTCPIDGRSTQCFTTFVDTMKPTDSDVGHLLMHDDTKFGDLLDLAGLAGQGGFLVISLGWLLLIHSRHFLGLAASTVKKTDDEDDEDDEDEEEEDEDEDEDDEDEEDDDKEEGLQVCNGCSRSYCSGSNDEDDSETEPDNESTANEEEEGEALAEADAEAAAEAEEAAAEAELDAEAEAQLLAQAMADESTRAEGSPDGKAQDDSDGQHIRFDN